MKFQDLNLSEPILKALHDKNYTGTGKTAAFAIPIIQHLSKDVENANGRRKILSLVVTPTRELAIQIGENFKAYAKYTKVRGTVIFGGVKQGSQIRALERGVDVLVATPGRLLDLMSQGYISLADVKYFILDEADRMLDMGFINDIKKLLRELPTKRQSLFFSATMPKNILKLSQEILNNPSKVAVNPVSSTAETIQQYIYKTNKKLKIDLLLHLLKNPELEQVLLFSRTKHGADKIVRQLKKKNIESAAIHGDKKQNQRQNALKGFKAGKVRVLVATDIAARGIDIDKLRYVINYDREEGISISLCEPEELAYVRDIEKLAKRKIEVIDDNPYPMTDKPMTAAEKKEAAKEKERRRQEFFANRKKKRNAQGAAGGGRGKSRGPKGKKGGNSTSNSRGRRR